jgi:phosphohistidine swiveling domain-containing protein
LNLIRFLHEAQEDRDAVNLVGGKFFRLARLAQAGFAVPSGFCLTAEAYRRHLSVHGLTDQIESILARLNLANDEKATRIQQAITKVDMSLDVHCVIVEAYHKLIESDLDLPLAVRSSALAEDAADASFAGQHDTFLNVRGETALLESVKCCWASLWTARSLGYRARLHPDYPGAALAVVVQRMVPADCAGVAFTVNPVTGEDEIVLEAVAGLGEWLVSGSDTPDRYRVEKQAWQVLESSPANRERAVLNPVQAQRIAQLAVDVERFFGCPQDIEWAQSDGRVYLLQSRPVTTVALPNLTTADGQVDMADLLRRAETTGSQIWTDDNVGEVVPGMVTPLSWSVLEPLGNEAFRSFLRRVGVRRYPAMGLFGRFYGRVYFNQSQFQKLMRRFYPSHLGRMGRGQLNMLGRFQAALALAETGFRALFLLLTLPRQALRLVEEIPSELKQAPAPKTLNKQTLWIEAERWRQIGQRIMSVHLAITILATLIYSLLEKLVSRWSDGAVETAHLVMQLPGMKSAEMGHHLAALAAEAATDSDLRGCFTKNSAEALGDCMSSLPPDHRFARRLAEFLDRHGHASLREFELAFPRWREDVSYVLTMLQNHLLAHGDDSPISAQEAQPATRQRATETMRRRLRLGARRLLFEVLLGWAQSYSLARENLKYTFVMAHSHLRDLYVALAGHLTEGGALDDTSDLFYLTREEIESFLTGHISTQELRGSVTRHRAEDRGHQEADSVPSKIIEQWPNGSLHPMILGQDGNGLRAMGETTLTGIAASPGQVTGRARVILDPLASARLVPGEILVAPSTNPAWAPLLLNASALVTEIGGLLSHGAIVAREYGLPAVLNVQGVTRIVRTGQQLVVDGHRGTVSLIDET